jgi:hypothetical protein
MTVLRLVLFFPLVRSGVLNRTRPLPKAQIQLSGAASLRAGTKKLARRVRVGP